MCAITAMKLSLEFEYKIYIYCILFRYLCLSGLDGERIYRPYPYCIPRALFLQPRCASLAWLWLRVAIDNERVQSEPGGGVTRDGVFFFCFSSLFLYIFIFISAPVSSCPTCLCTRIQLGYSILLLQKNPVAPWSQTGRGRPPSRQYLIFSFYLRFMRATQ